MPKVGFQALGARQTPSSVFDSGADDRLAVRLVLDGDVEAFGQVVEKYQRPLYTAALRMVGDADDARDVVQTTFVRAYLNLTGYKFRYKLFSWLYRIMVNQALNVLKLRRPLDPLDATIASQAPSPEQMYEAAHLKDRIQAALLEIAPHYREAIVLRHFIELSYGEMADLLDVPQKTVKSRLFTARRLLANLLFEPGAR